MEKNLLTTSFAENMDRSCPWNVYPRPNMKRDSFFCLNGIWDFEFAKNQPTEYTKKILVPFPPESRLSGVESSHADGELLYYRKKFTLPENFIKSRVILHFGAVDQIAHVTINGINVGSHEGGYLPFSFDVTDCVFECENEIAVICRDDLDKNYPYGKQKKKRGGMWYTPVSGIWQTVWLESIPEKAIEKISVTPTVNEAKIEVKTEASAVRLTLSDSGESFESADGVFVIAPKNPKLWSPETPYLYRFTLETATDKVESYFALREIGITKEDGVARLTLNGKPYLFNGLLDQGYFPDGIFTPATVDAYRCDIKTAKTMGFNTLRKHIKIEPAVFYYLCDEIGIAVFQDMVNNSDYSFIKDTALPTVGFKKRSDKRLHKNPKSRKIFTDTAFDTIRHLYNFPSVLYYTVFNEGWGQFTSDEIYKDAKIIDSTRIYDSTSGWFFGKESDVVSHHVYFKRLRIKTDSERPTVISEFGGYSHRVEGHLFGERNYGYKTFSSKEEYSRAVLSLYENEVLPLVKKGVSALIYTQLSDIEDETNGFMTYDRKVLKVDPDAMLNLSIKLKENMK